MLTDGIYKAENREGFMNEYEILVKVRETDKSYTITLLKFNSRYGATQISDMFSKSKKVLIKKSGSQHAMRVWGNDEFTIYPYRIGVPYFFKKIDGGQEE